MAEATTAVDPVNIPVKMSPEQLEWFILFGICVAGKGAKQTEKKLTAFLRDEVQEERAKGFKYYSPFDRVQYYITQGTLLKYLKKHKMGQYKRINKAFRAAVRLDLRDGVTIPMLEAIPGIGPKTARFIVLYADPKADCVPLDTHILKYLRSLGIRGVPKSTPQSPNKYAHLEGLFRLRALALGKTVRELDTEVWQSYAKI